MLKFGLKKKTVQKNFALWGSEDLICNLDNLDSFGVLFTKCEENESKGSSNELKGTKHWWWS